MAETPVKHFWMLRSKWFDEILEFDKATLGKWSVDTIYVGFGANIFNLFEEFKESFEIGRASCRERV